MNTVLLFLAVGFLMIGVHQTMHYGFQVSYWLFMVALGLVFWVQYRKKSKKN